MSSLDPSKPYWFLDIDGVINIIKYGGKPPKRTWTDLTDTTILGYPITYSSTLIEFINAADAYANIIWTTTWRGLANVHFGPEVGLRYGFPVAEDILNPALGHDGLLPNANLYPWTTDWHKIRLVRALLFRFGPDASFVWTDDDLRKINKAPLKEVYGDKALMITPFETQGLTPEHVTRIAQFLGMDGWDGKSA